VDPNAAAGVRAAPSAAAGPGVVTGVPGSPDAGARPPGAPAYSRSPPSAAMFPSAGASAHCLCVHRTAVSSDLFLAAPASAAGMGAAGPDVGSPGALFPNPGPNSLDAALIAAQAATAAGQAHLRVAALPWEC